METNQKGGVGQGRTAFEIRRRERFDKMWNAMTEEEKNWMYLMDPVSLTLGNFAFELLTKDPERPFIGIIDVEGKKWVKNNVGWTARDALIRYVGQALMEEEPNICRFNYGIGVREHADFEGEFAVYVRDEADLQDLMEKAKKWIPETLDLNGTSIQRDKVMKLVGVVGNRLIRPYEV
jgi:hypothetical protein